MRVQEGWLNRTDSDRERGTGTENKLSTIEVSQRLTAWTAVDHHMKPEHKLVGADIPAGLGGVRRCEYTPSAFPHLTHSLTAADSRRAGISPNCRGKTTTSSTSFALPTSSRYRKLRRARRRAPAGSDKLVGYETPKQNESDGEGGDADEASGDEAHGGFPRTGKEIAFTREGEDNGAPSYSTPTPIFHECMTDRSLGVHGFALHTEVYVRRPAAGMKTLRTQLLHGSIERIRDGSRIEVFGVVLNNCLVHFLRNDRSVYVTHAPGLE